MLIPKGEFLNGTALGQLPQDKQVVLYCKTGIRSADIHFVSREAMDVEGMGPALVEQLVDRELIKDPADIYFLSKDDLISLERMGEKSANNILGALDRSKKKGLAPLLFALGIRHVGIRAAEILAESLVPCKHLLRLMRRN